MFIIRQGVFYLAKQRARRYHQLPPKQTRLNVARITGVIAKSQEDGDSHAQNAERRDGKPDTQRGVPRQHDNHGDGKQEVKQQSGINFGKYRTMPDKNQLQPVLLRTNNHNQLQKSKERGY